MANLPGRAVIAYTMRAGVAHEDSSCGAAYTLAGVAEGYTRQSQKLLLATGCGFESHRRHLLQVLKNSDISAYPPQKAPDWRKCFCSMIWRQPLQLSCALPCSALSVSSTLSAIYILHSWWL